MGFKRKKKKQKILKMLKYAIAVVVFAAFISANVLPRANPVECSVCEYAVKYLESELEANATTSSIAKALENVCTLAPTSLQSVCDNLIEQYTPQIIFQLISRETPEAVCKAIQVCWTI